MCLTLYKKFPSRAFNPPKQVRSAFFSATSAGNYVSFNGIGSRELQLPIHSKHI